MKQPSPKQIEAAMAACRSIRFAVMNSNRHGGDFSLNDILAADRLAREALDCVQVKSAGELAAENKQLRGTLAATRANYTRLKRKGGKS